MTRQELIFLCAIFFFIAVGFAILYSLKDAEVSEAREQVERCRVYYDVLEGCRLRENRGGHTLKECLVSMAALNEECRQ